MHAAGPRLMPRVYTAGLAPAIGLYGCATLDPAAVPALDSDPCRRMARDRTEYAMSDAEFTAECHRCVKAAAKVLVESETPEDEQRGTFLGAFAGCIESASPSAAKKAVDGMIRHSLEQAGNIELHDVPGMDSATVCLMGHNRTLFEKTLRNRGFEPKKMPKLLRPLYDTVKQYAAAAWAEIEKRGLLDSLDMHLATKGELRVGMHACGLLVAWGKPDVKPNRTTDATGTVVEWVYSNPRRRVYTRDGFITSWQD